MQNKITSFLRKIPFVHRFFKFCYWKVKYFHAILLGTKINEKYWKKRHLMKGGDWGEKDENWIVGYWKSTSHPHRRLLIETIAKYSPSSILEIGSNCGPNLYLLAKKFPKSEIRGIDINIEAIKKGREFFKKEGISNVELIVKKADDLKYFKNKSFDVIFTDAVLIYIGKDKIRKIISEMQRIAKKAIILVEFHYEQENILGFYEKGFWVRNYRKLFQLLNLKTRIVKIPPNAWGGNWEERGFIIEVKL